LLRTALHLLQRFGLSAAFLSLAHAQLLRLWAALEPSTSGGVPLLRVQQLAQSAIQLAFDLLVAALLLFAASPERPPERVVHVIVPLASTFAYLAYGWVDRNPQEALRASLLPDLGLWGAFLGGLLVLLAYGLCIYALSALRRSFAIFVQVKEGVTRGPYRYVRHPMYLGYLLVVLAVFLVRPTLASALVGGLATLLMIYRARLEEQMLRAHVPGYAEYAARTGMLLPRLWRHRA